ncbi:MAG TPA: Fe-S cluster assembly protein SufD [Ignavibacteriaceae bacterium]|nr:Fe-S cluster assembly protein SufD [Ignavibacteriaceae bacterium]
MSQFAEIKEWYLNEFKLFENSLNGESTAPIHKIRKEAISNFSNLDFPNTRDEEWKYTNISPLLKYNFKPSLEKQDVKQEQVNKYLFDELEHSLLVFVNGHFDAGLSRIKHLPKGVIAGSIAGAIKEKSPVVEKHFGKYADYKNQIFTALSTAYTKDGAFIYVPDGKIVEEAIHILFLTTESDENILTQPRNLFVAGKNSQVRLIEHYASLGENIYFTNSVTEIFADENSIVDHVKLQEENRKSFHVARMEIDQEKNSNFSSHAISLGGDIARNDFNSRFNDEGGECMMNGLFLTDGTQLFDTHSLIDHAKPHCNSHEHYKGILDDKSRGVFNGKVIVRQDAQKTNAFQENNNIILSNDALINTKPQLEIFADDVKCSHGATIGQLDEEAMFYLKSRGIGEETSKSILIHAFASDVIKSIKIKAIKDYVEKILSNRFDG